MEGAERWPRPSAYHFNSNTPVAVKVNERDVLNSHYCTGNDGPHVCMSDKQTWQSRTRLIVMYIWHIYMHCMYVGHMHPGKAIVWESGEKKPTTRNCGSRDCTHDDDEEKYAIKRIPLPLEVDINTKQTADATVVSSSSSVTSCTWSSDIEARCDPYAVVSRRLLVLHVQ